MKRIPLILAVIILSTGCSSLFVSRTPVEILPSRTNIVQVVTTNTVQREVWTTNHVQVAPQRTNDVGIVLPPVFQLMPVRDLISTYVFQTNHQMVILPPVWFTNIGVGSGLETGIKVAGDLAPVPYGGLIAQALTALAGVGCAAYNWFGKRKAEKEAGVQTDLADTAKSAVVAVVKGVQEVRKVALQVPGYTEKMDSNVMQIVKGIQVAAGADVKNLVSGVVDEHTQSLSKTSPV